MSLSQNQMEMLQKSEEGKDGMTVIKLGYVYSKIRELEEEIARLNVVAGKINSTFQVHKFGGEIVEFSTLEEAKEAALDKFIIIGAEIIKKLSASSSGFYAKLCVVSLDKNFEFSVSNLSKLCEMSEKKIRIFTKELVDKKVLLRVARKKNRFFAGWDWILNPSLEDFEKFKDPCELQRKSAYKKMKSK